MLKLLAMAAIGLALASVHASVAEPGSGGLPSSVPAYGPGVPVEITIGSHRVKIPEHYFRYLVRQPSESRVSLALLWPNLTHGPWPQGDRLSMARAAVIDITATTTKDLSAEALTHIGTRY